MSKTSNYNCLDVGDRVRVIQSGGKLGPTLYEITRKDPFHQVMIREVGVAPNGKPYAAQAFDASLLKLVPDAKKTAKAMNESGVFRPFIMRG